MKKLVDAWRRHVQPLLWPPRCLLCGDTGQRPGTDLCAGCAADLQPNTCACIRCAEPLSGIARGAAGQPLHCGACLRRPPRFDVAHCPYVYGYPLDHLIKQFKYHDRLAAGRVLAELLSTAIRVRRTKPLPQVLIPVPLAPRRFRQRGYNQAIELGLGIERLLGIPLRADLIQRTRDTAEQAGLDQRARRRNIKGAFALTKALPATRIAIIDDVITTGSTTNELAKVLKRAGATYVEAWAVARATK